MNSKPCACWASTLPWSYIFYIPLPFLFWNRILLSCPGRPWANSIVVTSQVARLDLIDLVAYLWLWSRWNCRPTSLELAGCCFFFFLFLNFYLFMCFMYVSVLCVYTSAHQVRASDSMRITWDHSYSCLWSATWVLGIEFSISGRAANAFKHWASLQPHFLYY